MSSMPAKGKHHHYQQSQQQQQQHHHQQQQQQQQQHHQQTQHIISQAGVTGTPQNYNTAVANRAYVTHAGSEFHVPGQNYGAQPGAQVGGGAGSIGVPGGRGPPSLVGLPSIGQTTTGIQPGGPTGVQQQQQQQQQPPQVSTPGVQQQQQGPTPTTTPPVHTPSPQEMGKPAHLQAQQPTMQQPYGQNPNRPPPHSFYQMATRSQPLQPRNIAHRGSQVGAATHVSMAGVTGSPGQSPAMYPGHANIMSSVAPIFVPSAGIHGGAHQPVNFVNASPMSIYPQQTRHQPHHPPQAYYPSFQSHPMMPSLYTGFTPGQPPPAYCYQSYQPQNAAISINRPTPNAVTGAGQNVAGPLAGAQGTAGVPQNTLQQPAQQPQPIPPMSIALTQPTYAGHNGGTPAPAPYRKAARICAILDIVDPQTGLNVANEIYNEAGTAPSDETKNRDTPQPQNSAIIAEFASLVAKAASETTGTNATAATTTTTTTTTTSSPSSSSITATTTTTSTTTTSVQDTIKDKSLNTTLQTNVINQTSSQTMTNSISCTVPIVTPSTTNIVKSTIDAQSNAQVDVSIINNDTKQLSSLTKEFRPRSDINQLSQKQQQAQSIDEQKSQSVIKETPVVPAHPERDDEKVSCKISSTTAVTCPVSTIAREPVEKNLSTKKNVTLPVQSTISNVTTSDSAIIAEPAVPVIEAPKEQNKQIICEKIIESSAKTSETHKNGENNADKSDEEFIDGKAAQKKSKNKLKEVDTNRKSAEKEGDNMETIVSTVEQPKNIELIKKQDIKNDVVVTKVDDVCEISLKENVTTESKPDTDIEDKKIDDTVNIDKCSKTNLPVENHKNITTIIEQDNNKTTARITDKRANDVVDHAHIIKDKIIDVETLVAQKNQENSKVSNTTTTTNDVKPIDTTAAVVDNEDDNNDKENDSESSNRIDTPTINEHKYVYAEDQWSPTNPTGKKIYDSEFLTKIQHHPLCQIKPPNLPNLDIVQKYGTVRQAPSSRNSSMDFLKSSRNHEMFTPGFAKAGFNRMQVAPGNKKSFQGNNKKVSKSGVIHVSLSLHEDVKLRESENAWKPTPRSKTDIANDDEAKTQALYKKVRSILNKLTPQKFDTLVNQVRDLEIDSHERLQGVIDLVFQKALEEPNFSVAYALMCKQLAQMQIAGGDKKQDNETKQEKDNKTNFRTLILSRCQHEFESTTVDEVARASKLKEIDECVDVLKKKELIALLDDADRRLRMKSVGNIRFIGELYKQDMLRVAIMHTCIKHLLTTPDEDNLECLCKLLTTIGKTMESTKNNSFNDYFSTMTELTKRKTGDKKISSRVRFMLQDVIDLRAQKWKPRRDEGNPKTMDQVSKEHASEHLDIELNNTPINTPRKDDRNSDRRRNRGGNGNTNEDGWSVATKSTRQPYSVESSKLNAKVPAMDEMRLGGRDLFRWGSSAAAGNDNPMQNMQNKYALLDSMETDKKPSIQLPGSRSTGATRDYRPEYKTWDSNRGSRNGIHQVQSSSSSMSRRDSRENSVPEITSRSQSMSMPPPSASKYNKRPPLLATPPSDKKVLTEDQIKNEIITVLGGCKTSPNVDAFIDTAMDQLNDKLDNSTYPYFISESLNRILEKSSLHREYYSSLFAHMIVNKMFPISLFQAEYDKLIEVAEDLVIDLPKFWTYAAEILKPLVVRGAHPLNELKRTTSVLKNSGTVGKLVGELLTILAQSEGPKLIADKWNKSGIKWTDLVDTSKENPDNIVKEYNLEFLTNDATDKLPSGIELTYEQIHDQLIKLLRDSDFDNITSWITASVGQEGFKKPKFIRTLVTSILETVVEPLKNSYKVNRQKLDHFLPLMARYVDTNPELELQCLYALTAFNHKLENPQGVLCSIIDGLYEVGVVSDNAFLAWQTCTDKAEMLGHGCAVLALTSFFVQLKEGHEESSEEA
ncbi:eukaryotic translation initiation factor 4 gamma 3-like isoform X2 [Aphidius gifuensis]|uniref:eukaryotic translation initiation factor 4 gamma 3-like isoform X2 n=1 Tax=Aphidius gifuensis TaxID=684658 RepID=UPI001CDD4605|nr:eukaryotic translation initiation factor 4 gamma 3-like isoform X2 [Aphidius gifuensis]